MRRIAAIIYAAFMTSVVIFAKDPPPIRVEVTPKVQMSGRRNQGEVYVKLTVPRDDRNRAVCVVIDGPTFRSSCHSLDGQRAAYREEWPVKALDAGSYSVFANLERAGGVVLRATDQFCIAGDGGGCGIGLELSGMAEEP